MKPLALLALLLTLLPNLALADAKAAAVADKKIIVTCQGEVTAFTPFATHDIYADGGRDWSDETVIRLTSPEEWKGHELQVLSKHLPDDHPLRKFGNSLSFKIAKVYLVRQYENENGSTNEHWAFDGALEILPEPDAAPKEE